MIKNLILFYKEASPHSADVIVQTIGDMGRQLRHSLNRKSDFPLPVIIETRDGRKITTTLESLYADGSSQADGTFYFTESVRDDHQPNQKFLWGHEIKTITIRKSK